MSAEHYLLIQSVTEKSREKEHFVCKFNKLQITSSKRDKQQITTTYVKPSIVNLTDIALTDYQTSLLNLGLKFVPTEKRITFMEIITATASVALILEYHNKETDAKSLSQNVCHILNKNRNMKIEDNLSKNNGKHSNKYNKSITTPRFTHSIKVQHLLLYQCEMQSKR